MHATIVNGRATFVRATVVNDRATFVNDRATVVNDRVTIVPDHVTIVIGTCVCVTLLYSASKKWADIESCSPCHLGFVCIYKIHYQICPKLHRKIIVFCSVESNLIKVCAH